MAKEKTKEELKNEIEKLKKELLKLSQEIEQKEDSKDDKKNVILDKDRDILFTSLCVGILNLNAGDNNFYTFNKFGEEINIPYQDAKTIVRLNKKFISEGLVFIDDKDFIKAERLNSVYEKIINKEEFLELLNKDRNSFLNIFNNMPNSQKEALRDIIITKLIKGDTVDMNIITAVDDALYGKLPVEIKKSILSEVESLKGMGLIG